MGVRMFFFNTILFNNSLPNICTSFLFLIGLFFFFLFNYSLLWFLVYVSIFWYFDIV